ncbi:MAG: hypothetical protein HC882_07015 [Acidobacteria bacterium]|nr:hypothetical protein [Acidobacteriota bacterium]
MKQGTAPRLQLINRFREEIGMVLLGTESFWAGVDVPGDALEAVVIDKIPFPSPDDPLLDALDHITKDSFKTYSMPRAIIQLRQGFGRLIRTTSDKGVVVICDRRLTDKPYGRSFLKSLPEAQRSFSLDDVERFFSRTRAAS